MNPEYLRSLHFTVDVPYPTTQEVAALRDALRGLGTMAKEAMARKSVPEARELVDRLLGQGHDLTGIYLYVNPLMSLVLLDVMDWGEESVGDLLFAGLRKIVGKGRIVRQNEGPHPKGGDWVRVYPKPDDRDKEAADRELDDRAATPDTRPYRERAEMYALKDGKVFGGLYPHGGFGVFGGGIDPGEDPADAAAREFLEESGWRVTNPRPLPFKPHTLEWRPPYASAKQMERARQFRGSRTHYFLGDLGEQVPDYQFVEPVDRRDVRLYDLDEAGRLANPALDDEPALAAFNRRRQAILRYLKGLGGKEAADKPRTAVIITGNPRFTAGNPEAAAFYDRLAEQLAGHGYATSFDPGEPYTVPEDGDLWVGHSRGADRLRFAPRGVRTVAVGSSWPGAINHPEDDVTTPFHELDETPSAAHYQWTSDMLSQLGEAVGPGPTETSLSKMEP